MGHDARLAQLGISLPPAPPPAANYVPTVRSGNLLYVAGQVPTDASGFVRGCLGAGMDTAAGAAAARLCALSVLSQVRAALGSLDPVVRVVKVTGWVAATPDFTEHPEVINGASEVFVEVFGEAGRHARAAVGAPSLPRGVPVEVEAVLELA